LEDAAESVLDRRRKYMSEESDEISTEEWFCFELIDSEVFVSKEKGNSFAQRKEGDDDDEVIVLEQDGKVLFEDEIELFESDLLTRELFNRYLEYRTKG
jgi:hypothetical protein